MSRNRTVAAVVILAGAVSLVGMSMAADSEDKAPRNTQGDESKAEPILAKVWETYRTCKSYADTGTVKTVNHIASGNLVLETPFKTHFVRGDQFRFEYESKFPIPGATPMKHIIWAKNDDVQSWWDIEPGVVKEPSLEMAIAKATGVSSGCAATIPALLFPEFHWGKRTGIFQESHRIEDDLLNGESCYRFRVARPGSDDESTTLWINKATFLIHRIDESSKIPASDHGPGFKSEATTIYHPKVNIELKQEDLAFNPPRKAEKKR